MSTSYFIALCRLFTIVCVSCFAKTSVAFTGPSLFKVSVPTASRSDYKGNRIDISSQRFASSVPLLGEATSRLSELISTVSTGFSMMAAGGGKKTAIITGSSSGIGLEAARTLAASGDWHVIMAVRSFSKAITGARERGMNPSTYTVMDLDLASLESVRKFADAIKAANIKPDALVCNAAVWYPKDKKPRRTADGFEEAVGVNHLGHFLLCNLLLDDLKKSRVIFIGTETHNPDSIAGKIPPQAHLGDLEGLAKNEDMIDSVKFEPTKAYKDSKVCNVLMMREMDKRFAPDGMVVSALFPGCIAESPLFREKRGWFRTLFPLFQKYVTKQFVSTEEAGRRVAEVVSSPQFSRSGAYWRWNGQTAEATARENVVSDEAMDDARCEKLWQISSKLVGVS